MKLQMNYEELLDYSKEIQKRKTGNSLNIAVISNICFEPYFTPLLVKQFFDECNLQIYVRQIPYQEYKYPYNLETCYKADLIVVWLNIETLLCGQFYTLTNKIQDDINALCQNLYNDLFSNSQAKIIWFLFEDYSMPMHVVVGHIYNEFVDKMNIALCCSLENQVSFVNLQQLIAQVGITEAYNLRSKYRWNAPYSKSLIECAVKAIYKQYLIEKGITKKCLVLDCDNVLWGGIVSEDGIENLRLGGNGLGRIYQDFQRFVLSLYYHGVILAVCSKNDLSDVMTMFHNHNEMILEDKHIACFQVNWDDKPSNIKIIAE